MTNRPDLDQELRKLFLELPLYQRASSPAGTYRRGRSLNAETAEDHALKLLSASFHFDCFCFECERESTFRFDRSDSFSRNFLSVKFTCSREDSHVGILYFFELSDTYNEDGTITRTLQKVGQIPSIADLEKPALQKYRKLLGVRFTELTRAVGLIAHGVGIGAFVYLRRIFEHLINGAAEVAASKPDWSRTNFIDARMEDKIVLLKNHLPPLMVENRKMYSIMSKAILIEAAGWTWE